MCVDDYLANRPDALEDHKQDDVQKEPVCLFMITLPTDWNAHEQHNEDEGLREQCAC